MIEAREQALESAAWRRMLSLALARPTGEALARLERLAQTLGEEELAAAAAAADPQEVGGEYERLFGSDGVVPPYEGDYERDPFRRTRLLADVAGFYRAFGAEAAGPEGERPDHAGCELEFLAFLSLRRSECLEGKDAAGAAVCREAEEAFLRDHLGRWLPSFLAELEAEAEVPLYCALAKAGARLWARELAERGIDPPPARRWTRPRRSAVEEDELTCGNACAVAALQAHGRPL